MATNVGDLYAYVDTTLQTTDPLYRVYTNSSVLTAGNELYTNQGEYADATINGIDNDTFTIQEYKALNYPDNSYAVFTRLSDESLANLCKINVTLVTSAYGCQGFISQISTSKFARLLYDETTSVYSVWVEKNNNYQIRAFKVYRYKPTIGSASYYLEFAYKDINVAANASTIDVTFIADDYVRVAGIS